MSKRKRTRRFIVRLLGFVVLVFFMFSIWLAYFLYSNDAPLLHGEIQYHIPFGAEQKLDVYYPTEDVYEEIPVILFIHGGAWIGGDKVSVNNNRFNSAFNMLRNKGYAIVSPDYTLARDGKSPFPQNIIDSFDAVQWVNQNADIYKFDLDNLIVMGESAGAHLGMMVTFADPSDFGLNYQKLQPSCMIDIYGPSNLFSLYQTQNVDSLKSMIAQLPGPLKEQFDLPTLLFGFNPEENPDKAQVVMDSYSPLKNVTENDQLPILIIHGEDDQVVSFEQSVELMERLDSLEIGYDFHSLAGVNHAFRGATEMQKDSVQEWITDFVLSNYKE